MFEKRQRTSVFMLWTKSKGLPLIFKQRSNHYEHSSRAIPTINEKDASKVIMESRGAKEGFAQVVNTTLMAKSKGSIEWGKSTQRPRIRSWHHKEGVGTKYGTKC
ncbi:hypothetical protein GOP47_0011707 [Adiantum capillus-veneris]|uniref:Uncharacterized protein n=1 Tax=Adiantum capillus-veneris TaxID=13818 RepID=A0A9D4UTP6_ADICA|nr:hypothetical protein GOP47_0011707 [Adiantum capillus-veneris]